MLGHCEERGSFWSGMFWNYSWQLVKAVRTVLIIDLLALSGLTLQYANWIISKKSYFWNTWLWRVLVQLDIILFIKYCLLLLLCIL